MYCFPFGVTGQQVYSTIFHCIVFALILDGSRFAGGAGRFFTSSWMAYLLGSFFASSSCFQIEIAR
jgi:hypothetical protein